MASSSSTSACQSDSESEGTAPRCSSCFGWVSSFIPCCSVHSNLRPSTSNADLVPDNKVTASISTGRPERESTSRISISAAALLPDNEASTSTGGLVSGNEPVGQSEMESTDRLGRESTSRASVSTVALIPDNKATTSTSGSKAAFDGIAPSASTSGSKRIQKPRHDVFINHRGPDVKHTFASVLYGILTGMSLSVFLDSEELEYGDFLPGTIQAAMAGALLHIAIFSKGYAESPWCLAELAFMLKSGAKIIPIFYHVDPSDLRWVDQGKGMYAQAFEEHQRKGRYNPQQLQEWMSALYEVSFYTGQIIKTNEDEMRLLKNIVRCVLKEINDKVPLMVAKHPVGLEEIVQDFKANTLQSFKANTLQSGHDDQNVQIVGIWGMGGSGKTTLAKELYNQLSFSMDRSSFVFDVRDAATKGLLHEKQKKLLKDLGVQNLEFDNIEEGMRNLSRGLRSNRVLIVLDDVDNVEQLNILLPIKDSLERGSLIIVTTRAYDVLRSWGIYFIYKMRQLDPSYAKQLFCWHAFLKPYPSDEFKELVEKFLEVCNGLPLSLKVFGGQLHGEFRKEHWESQLNKISRILSKDIKQILKISYDSLDYEEKEMFLDTACFFIRQECGLAIEVWKGMGWSALQNWERLLNRCLVELDNDNFIIMHDHLRDLGRDIANKQSPYRLWFPQQIIDIQKQVQKTIGFQGIIITSNQIELDDYDKEFKYMIKKIDEVDEFCIWCSQGKFMAKTNGGIWSLKPFLIGLKYLVISGDYFNQVMSDISREVVWLRWFQIGLPNVPSGLSLKKLRILEIFESIEGEHHLEELWTDGKQAPVQLRQLLISHCYNFQGFPNSIGHLKYLKKIVIIRGLNVRKLQDEFCLLQSLEYLVLDGCKMISSLPSNFGNLRNLRHLRLSRWYKLKRLPVSFRNLRLLEYLNLEWCTELTFRSEDLNFLENITKLESLELSWCRQLEELPRHITNQASLRVLDFSFTSLRELPDNIGQLRRLRTLTVESVPLTNLPSSFGDLSSLTALSINGLDKLERLPDSLGDLSSLISLSISRCPKLKCLPDSLGDLSSLTSLEITYCHKLKCLPDSLGDLSSLTSLEITDCTKLKCLPDSLGDLSSLTSLEITDCTKLEREGVKSLPKSIRQLNHLQRLSIEHIPINELDFRGLNNLKETSLRETEVCRISFSEACCPHLESLRVVENRHLKEIEALPRTLQSISLTDCEMLNSIPSFAGLISLREFHLQGCYGIEQIEGLENCTRLENLFAQTCWEVPGIESLEHMQNLKELVLKANKGAVIEHCIQRIQKWPDEIRICAGAVPDAASLVEDSLLSPNLVIVESISNQNIKSGLESVLKAGISDGDAIMFCFVVNCVSSQMKLWLQLGRYVIALVKGRWALVRVVTRHSRKVEFAMNDGESGVAFGIEGEGEGKGEVEKCLVVRGAEQTIMEALRSLLPIFS